MNPGSRSRKVQLLILALCLGSSILVGWSNLAAQSQTPGNNLAQTPLVIRVYYENIDDLAELQSLDIWEYNNLSERYILAAASYTQTRALVDNGWRVVIDPAAATRQFSNNSRSTDLLADYRTVAELYSDLETLIQNHPGLVELVEYGESHCLSHGGCTTLGGDLLPGFPLRALRVTNEAIPGSSLIDDGSIIRGDKPVFFLIANIHAREIATPEIAMRFIDYLLDGYGVDADATWLVDHHEIWVVPLVNPDGHWLVELGTSEIYNGYPFFQRKNANNDIDGNGTPDCLVWPPTTFSQYGIDLNRNHSFGWGGPGASTSPCDMTFRGSAAASESEVAALENLIRALLPDQREPTRDAPAPDDTTGIFITLHSYSNLVLWPWGDTSAPAPNMTGLKAIGDRLAAFNGYQSCQSGPCLYPTSGASDDWVYGELGVPAYTFEIGDMFMPPYSEIDRKLWPENRGALIHAAKLARTPYMTVHGPDAMNLVAASTGNSIIIRAVIDDDLSGSNPIAAAVVGIDVPPWETGAEMMPMEPDDGSWSSSREPVSGVINAGALTTGRHILYVQGQDSEGHWGPVSAIFFDHLATIVGQAFFPISISP